MFIHSAAYRPNRPLPPSTWVIWQIEAERMTGIEPPYSAWEADVLPLNYIREGLASGTVPAAAVSVPAVILSDRTPARADRRRAHRHRAVRRVARPAVVDRRAHRQPVPGLPQPHRRGHRRQAGHGDLTELIEIARRRRVHAAPGRVRARLARSSASACPTTSSARIEGKSSLGRLGLLIHSTAGFIDAGFDGHITLELANVASLPITLYPGMKIGQVSFMQMTTPADKPYGSGAHGLEVPGPAGPDAEPLLRELREVLM